MKSALALVTEEKRFWICNYRQKSFHKFLSTLMISPSFSCTTTRVHRIYYHSRDRALILRFSKVVHSFFIWLFYSPFPQSEFLIPSKKQKLSCPFASGKKLKRCANKPSVRFKSRRFRSERTWLCSFGLSVGLSCRSACWNLFPCYLIYGRFGSWYSLHLYSRIFFIESYF